MASPDIQWYPGHIAKAEKALVDQLSRVDVVLDVRDARIPLSTCHPRLDQWVGDRGRVLVLNRVDMISPAARQRWERWFRQQGQVPWFTNAQQGQGVKAIAQAAQLAGQAVNQRRQARGMKPRPIRAVVIGFPNVGKSALINRLLNRRVVDSARRAGVTRQLRWVRLAADLDLLDAPGVMPARLTDQAAALKLAMCDDIGVAAYDSQRIATAFLDLLQELEPRSLDSYGPILKERYGLDLRQQSGEAWLADLASQRFHADQDRAAKRLLNDFRTGLLGAWALEWPPAPAVPLQP
ncbi:MAG: ribosome biogenesis GTPase YlqF [Cyanobacteriota bacterium]|nr:ribosome biogenesis GTPase YlqF [Cyanobacteriota bacterium]